MKTDERLLMDALSDVKPDSALERLKFVVMAYIALGTVVMFVLALLFLFSML